MTRRVQENIVSAALLLLFAGVIWLCQDFGPRARMIPLPLAVFGIVLTVIQIIWQNVGSTDELQMDMIRVARPAAGMEAASAGRAAVTWREEARALGVVAALLGLILTAGLLPAVFLFTAGYFRLTGQYAWLPALLYTSALTASVYLLFVVALQMQPYHGLLALLADIF